MVRSGRGGAHACRARRRGEPTLSAILRCAARCALAVGRRVHDDLVAPARLRAIQRVVGEFQRGLDGVAAFRIAGRHADARGHAAAHARVVADAEIEDAGADRLGDRDGAVRVDVGQHDDEFLAAVTGRVIGRPAQAAGDAAADRGERIVAGLMALRVVVVLEVIDVDEQQRQRVLRARGAPPFARERDVEHAAVVEPGEAVGARERLQLGFRALAFAQLHVEQQRQPDEADRERDHRRADRDRAVVPRGVGVGFGARDHQNQRQVLEVAEHVEAAHAVDRRGVGETALACRHEMAERARMADVAADDRRIVRLTRDHQAVGLDQRDRAAIAERQPREQVLEIFEPDRHHRDAAERAVGPRDPPAERDAQGAVAQARMVRVAHVQPDVRMIAMDGEIRFVREIGLARDVGLAVDRDVAVRVEHVDAAEVLGRRRAVEQHLAPQRHRQIGDCRVVRAVDHRLQRQRVDFDVALDVPRRHQRDVLLRGAGAVACVDAAFVQHDRAQQQQQQTDQQPRVEDQVRQQRTAHASDDAAGPAGFAGHCVVGFSHGAWNDGHRGRTASRCDYSCDT